MSIMAAASESLREHVACFVPACNEHTSHTPALSACAGSETDTSDDEHGGLSVAQVRGGLAEENSRAALLPM